VVDRRVDCHEEKNQALRKRFRRITNDDDVRESRNNPCHDEKKKISSSNEKGKGKILQRIL